MTFDLKINRQRYGRKVVLREISQPYVSELIHGFLGENGAGKTTLFQCMAGLLPFDGERFFPSDLRVGYLPAELYMYPMITGREFLHFYVTARDLPWEDEHLTRLNTYFALPLDEYADTYSTGMLKKLYLMGLFMQKNDVLLLDEPFNGLDFRTSAFVTALLDEYRKLGHTVFVASHDMEHLFSYVDTISIVRDGSLTFYEDRSTFVQLRADIVTEASKLAQNVSLM